MPRPFRRLLESITFPNLWLWLDHCDPIDILPIASSADLIRARWASSKCRDNWHCHKFVSNLPALSLASTWEMIVEAWRPWYRHVSQMHVPHLLFDCVGQNTTHRSMFIRMVSFVFWRYQTCALALQSKKPNPPQQPHASEEA